MGEPAQGRQISRTLGFEGKRSKICVFLPELNQRDLKLGGLSSGKAERGIGSRMPAFKETHNKESMPIQPRSSSLKNAWSIREGKLFAHLRACVEEQGSLEDPFRNKRAVRCPLPPLPLGINTQPPMGTSRAPPSTNEIVYTKPHSPRLQWICSEVHAKTPGKNGKKY